MIDEADSFLADHNELRGIVNSGHTATSAFVIRVVGDGANADVRKFSTWCPKVFCAIGKLPSTGREGDKAAV
jgi:putative DNA primase/helicase